MFLCQLLMTCTHHAWAACDGMSIQRVWNATGWTFTWNQIFPLPCVHDDMLNTASFITFITETTVYKRFDWLLSGPDFLVTTTGTLQKCFFDRRFSITSGKTAFEHSNNEFYHSGEEEQAKIQLPVQYSSFLFLLP